MSRVGGWCRVREGAADARENKKRAGGWWWGSARVQLEESDKVDLPVAYGAPEAPRAGPLSACS